MNESRFEYTLSTLIFETYLTSLIGLRDFVGSRICYDNANTKTDADVDDSNGIRTEGNVSTHSFDEGHNENLVLIKLNKNGID